MNTKSKLKAISIGIAAIMMVSLLAAVTTVSASDVTDCEFGDDNKVYFTIHSDVKADGQARLDVNGAYEESKKYTLNAGDTTTLSFRYYRWNGVDDVEICADGSCCNPEEETQKPDLIVSDKWEEPVDGQVIVHFTVENIGDGDAGASTACKEINGVLMDTASVPALEAGMSYASAFDPEDCPSGETIAVTVCADNFNDVDESNEDNNCLTNDFDCPIPPKPDLVVSDKWETLNEDGKVIVHFEIHNQGDADAGASFATKYMYIDGVLVEKHNAPVPELGPSGRFNGAFEPEDCPSGVVITVIVCADDTHVVDESNEDNNCMTNYFTCPTLGEPDLVVSDKYETLNEDGKVIVHFEIHNQGDADAGASFATKYMYIDGVLVEKHNAPVPELGPSGRFNGVFEPEDCPSGVVITVIVCADDTKVVDESNEDNNCMTNYFTCPTIGEPDLVVIEKWEDSVDGQVIVHFVVKNIGGAEAGASYATLYIDSVLVEEQNVPVPALGPNGKFTSAFKPEPCSPGETISVMVCADDTKVVDESNEGNNCMTNDFTCPEVDRPDLVVNDTYETLNEDGQVIVHFVVKNIGDADAGKSEAALYINSVRVQTQNVPVSAVGPSGTFSSEFEPEPCPSGMTINYTVCADDTKVVDESNEDNNCMTNNFTCPTIGEPDLVVENKWEEPVKANGHVIVHFIIHNNGTANAGASFATLYIDDMLVGIQNVYVPELGPSGTFSGAFAPEECPLDNNITVKVCADDTHVVDESNETNNCMTNYFTCLAQGPDLVIEKTVDMENYHCDECRYKVNYKVTNNGNEVACSECTLGVNRIALLEDGELVDLQLCPQLGPGASYEGVFTGGWFDPGYTCPCGEDFDVTVCADYYNVVDESNETNNCETNHEYCGIGAIEVDKRVWYQGGWRGTYWGAEYCDIVEFRGIVSNDGCCCELTDITVTDVLSRSLEYVDATPTPETITYNTDGTTTLTWTESQLTQCGINSYEYYYITAHVIGCGENDWDRNTMTANATTCTGEVVDDSDYARVYAPPEADMTVTKKVRDPATGAWVDTISVWDGTDVTFKLTVRNDGTCHDLYNIQVWDELSESLEYTGSFGPQWPWGPQVPVVTGPDVNGVTTVDWNLVTMIPLEPGEELVFYVYATAHGFGPTLDINHLQATAYSVERGTPFGTPLYDEDWAFVWTW